MISLYLYLILLQPQQLPPAKELPTAKESVAKQVLPETKPHLPTPPCPNCQCGCTETGKCSCKDCDHPQLEKPMPPRAKEAPGKYDLPAPKESKPGKTYTRDLEIQILKALLEGPKTKGQLIPIVVPTVTPDSNAQLDVALEGLRQVGLIKADALNRWELTPAKTADKALTDPTCPTGACAPALPDKETSRAQNIEIYRDKATPQYETITEDGGGRQRRFFRRGGRLRGGCSSGG
jgi:hypothetical protein